MPRQIEAERAPVPSAGSCGDIGFAGCTVPAVGLREQECPEAWGIHGRGDGPQKEISALARSWPDGTVTAIE